MTTFANLASAARANLLDNGKFSVTKVADVTISIGARGRALDADIHAAAYACLHFAMPTSVSDVGAMNAEPARFLVASMPRGSRQKCLADWFEAHSNIRLRQDKKTKAWSCGIAKKDAKTYIPADELRAMAAKGWGNPFFSPEEVTKGAKAFDFDASFAAMLKKAVDNLGNDDPRVAALQELASAHHINLEKKAKAA